jgi:hypothetical protein
MNRWARIVLALSALATLAWAGAGLAGRSIVDDLTLARHTLLSFVVLLALVLTHAWVAMFALVSSGLLRRRIAPPAVAARELARARWSAVIAAAVAMAAALGQFLVSNALYPARLKAGQHGLFGWASVAILVLAWLAERQALARHGRALATLTD